MAVSYRLILFDFYFYSHYVCSNNATISSCDRPLPPQGHQVTHRYMTSESLRPPRDHEQKRVLQPCGAISSPIRSTELVSTHAYHCRSGTHLALTLFGAVARLRLRRAASTALLRPLLVHRAHIATLRRALELLRPLLHLLHQLLLCVVRTPERSEYTNRPSVRGPGLTPHLRASAIRCSATSSTARLGSPAAVAPSASVAARSRSRSW